MQNIAYQNKDITQKYSAELLKDKSLAVYGLPHIHIKELLPTNLPAIEANELRMDNLFLLKDGTIAIIDYESTFGPKDVIKYANYIARVLKRYVSDNRQQFPYLHLIIIFSADIENVDPLIADVGCMKLWIEPAFLVHIPTETVYKRLREKIDGCEPLSEEELMQLIILPLTVKGTSGKQKQLVDTVRLAQRIPDNSQRIQALSGILTFSDKIIERQMAARIRRLIRMNKVVQLLYEDGGEQKVISLVRKKLAKHMTPKAIADMLEEDSVKIENIARKIAEHPEADDQEIYFIICDEAEAEPSSSEI
ncbi:hypothetical protein [Frisingicoccus sp.]|uniref:hypothetical protein n=1 Tax=Frisingicoccus sp. TaxID=1918627 RepID=UPI002E7703A7|nr:hypothetical protein [Frisingicoccus sp.]MEE0752034.1 hypothetical protein [Frisingicoccus sp.]